MIREASVNDLRELRHLINELNFQIERYSHVTDYLHQSVQIGIDRAEKQIHREIERRGI